MSNTTVQEKFNKVGDRLVKKCQERLIEWYVRWSDEKEYEDWNDYVEAMKKIIPEDIEFVSASKRPFGFTVKITDTIGLSIGINSRTMTLKSVRI